MFENLSNREKKLMLAIGALVPIAIIFFGIFRMTAAFKKNKQDLDSVNLAIGDQEALEIEGMLADRRQAYYTNASLHPSINIASNDYQNWLKKTMTESGLDWAGVTLSEGSRLRSNNEDIGQSKLFKSNATCTLPELNDFLSKFYQLDVLHRIKDMTLIPLNEPRSNAVRTGDLVAKFTFEALSLKAGKNRNGFEEFRTHLANSEKDYNLILRRNIFGPANSEPVITASNKSTTEGEAKKYYITAKDADKNDLLKFELVKKSVDNAVLTQADETDRRAQFELPSLTPGKYEFTVKVSDSGNPVKSSTKTFTVTVNKKREPAKPKEKRVDPPPKLVDYVRLVKVTGLTYDLDGKWRVWISIGHTGERLRLAEGDTFKLGEKKYEVVSVDENEATFAGDEKTFVARPDYKTRGKLVETKL